MERRPKVNKYPLTWVLSFQFFKLKIIRKVTINSELTKWRTTKNRLNKHHSGLFSRFISEPFTVLYWIVNLFLGSISRPSIKIFIWYFRCWYFRIFALENTAKHQRHHKNVSWPHGQAKNTRFSSDVKNESICWSCNSFTWQSNYHEKGNPNL